MLKVVPDLGVGVTGIGEVPDTADEENEEELIEVSWTESIEIGDHEVD